jgi:hypothetical protein
VRGKRIQQQQQHLHRLLILRAVRDVNDLDVSSHHRLICRRICMCLPRQASRPNWKCESEQRCRRPEHRKKKTRKKIICRSRTDERAEPLPYVIRHRKRTSHPSPKKPPGDLVSRFLGWPNVYDPKRSKGDPARRSDTASFLGQSKHLKLPTLGFRGRAGQTKHRRSLASNRPGRSFCEGQKQSTFISGGCKNVMSSLRAISNDVFFFCDEQLQLKPGR